MSIKQRQFYRQGPDHRAGQEIDFVEVRRRFDFRSIELGRWVTKQERSRAAGLFYDALCDLMLILQGPEQLVSLRGTLGLQYGTGGRPGVSAHYDPSRRAFALAKNAGPGSIAHEWFHALDHYLSDKVFTDAPSGLFASAAWLDDATPVVHPLNDLWFALMKAVLLDESGREPSELFNHSVSMDRKLRTRYYSRPEEICARAFEAFVQDASVKNHFLVKGTRESPEAQNGLYPRDDERQRINQAFADYFYRLGAALSRQA
ncbi:CLCA_X family protein [Marinobacterium stanieri]|uniref:CLCA_X family protein n=1 Tax=Marinobacterium stanieri TaxID=49186 RepID=UPI0002557C8A|nr:CLCA_X family protein [Marinobacterium stanieri]